MSMTSLPRRGDDPTSVRGQLLRMLRDRGPMPRVTLARASGLSPTTITRAVAALLDEGLVIEGDTVSPSRVGRPATEVRLAEDVVFVVGVQLGVGFARLGLFDVVGRIVRSSEIAFADDEPATSVLASLAESIRGLIDGTADVAFGSVLGVGVAAPGAVEADSRRVIRPVNLRWRDVRVSDILEQSLGLPVLVQHNVRSMAVAEARVGGGRGLDSIGFVYLRTGLGAGLALDGQAFDGGFNGAIEIGHLKTDPADRLCVCGSRGCLETVVADYALRDECAQVGLDPGAAGPLPTLYAHRERAEVAARVQHIIGQLAIGLSSLGTLLNPQAIFLGGVLAEMPSTFLDELERRTRESLFFLIRENVRIEPSSLGVDAGVMGGGTLALDAYFYE